MQRVPNPRPWLSTESLVALCSAITLVGSAVSAPPLLAQPPWQFDDQTLTRISADPSLVRLDPEEKDFGYDDVDGDGDIDLVVVRRGPFGSLDPKPNVLLMNEAGVLVDRTLEYASDSDVPGDTGFLTATNDRDVALVDVDGDGWLDIVTAVTLSDGQPKVISHPRVYHNLGLSGGVWQGFRYEDARIPQLEGFAPSGFPHAPRFSEVATGDVDGDGSIDLYFVDHDAGPVATFDFDNRLLLNDGNGYFSDASEAAFLGMIELGGGFSFPFTQSQFGIATRMADMNGDGKIDLVQDTAVGGGHDYIGIAYNASDTLGAPWPIGLFQSYQVVNELSPYYVDAGDLNGDGRMDLLAMDDGQDHYHLNAGNDADGHAVFTIHSFEDDGLDPGFTGNTRIADLDRDGFPDVYSTNCDIDVPSCQNRSLLYRNLGDVPDVTLQVEPVAPWTPPGGHDVALFDVDGDEWLDIVIGTCEGTEVWIQQPPMDQAFLRGDANVDGDVDVADPIALLDFIFDSGHPPTCLDSGDANDDGTIDIADPIRLLAYLFSAGAPLPEPSSICDLDPSDDALSCSMYSACP